MSTPRTSIKDDSVTTLTAYNWKEAAITAWREYSAARAVENAEYQQHEQDKRRTDFATVLSDLLEQTIFPALIDLDEFGQPFANLDGVVFVPGHYHGTMGGTYPRGATVQRECSRCGRALRMADEIRDLTTLGAAIEKPEDEFPWHDCGQWEGDSNYQARQATKRQLSIAEELTVTLTALIDERIGLATS